MEQVRWHTNQNCHDAHPLQITGETSQGHVGRKSDGKSEGKARARACAGARARACTGARAGARQGTDEKAVAHVVHVRRGRAWRGRRQRADH